MLKQRQFYQFGNFQLEPDERTLLRGGKPLFLTDKAFNVLVMLVKNHDRLVRRDQIIKEVWPSTFGDFDSNLDVQMTTIRKMLGEHYIETVPKHGYRFTAKVIERSEDLAEDLPPVKSKRAVWLVAALLPVVVLGLYAAFRARVPRAATPHDAVSELYQRALEYERVGDDEQALATLDQALALRPSYQEACLRAAFIAYELEDSQKATKYLRSCKATDSIDEALRLKAQGLDQILADNSTRGMELFQLLIDRYPRDTDALYRFAELATDKDRLEEADKALRACTAVEPENPYCRFQGMYVKLKQNKFDDILVEYRSLPASVRDYPWFDEPVGIALLGKGQLDKATQAFDRLSQRQQRLHGTSHFTAGKEWVADVLLYQGRVKEATRRIQQIMKTSDNAPSRGVSLAYLAQIYSLVGDTGEAAKFAKEVATAPPDPTGLLKAALVLASLGDSAGMERLLKLRSEATHSQLSAANDHLIRGALAVALGDTKSGIEEIRLVRDLNSRDEEAAYQLGVAYFRAGDFDSAAQMFRAVTDLRGAVLLDNVPLMLPLATYRIAQCYERTGDAKAATLQYSELLRMWELADDDIRQRYLQQGDGRQPSLGTRPKH